MLSKVLSAGITGIDSYLISVEVNLYPSLPNFDPAILAKLGSLAGQGQMDGNQQALLTALHPYLSRRKVDKLERAMRAAKMARMASSFLGQGGLSLLTGR